jgi:hypothetical protein
MINFIWRYEMFFIMGISQKEKKLNFDQLIVCKCCGRYGHIEVYMTYTYLMLFFIPVFQWNKHYYARMNCCGSACELNPELGRAIIKGEVTSLDPDNLGFTCSGSRTRHCDYCGFTTSEDYQFCPRCGKQLTF